MKKIFVLLLLLMPVFPAFATDETACMLIAMGQIRLGDINDRIAKKYPSQKGTYWNIAGTAYHEFSKTPETDVIIGVSGYRDVGVVYNSERQMVEDAGSGFAYFHKVQGDWKLIQVELGGGKKYEGYEGADLTVAGRDQLVVYSSSGTTQIADIYAFKDSPEAGSFKKLASFQGFGEGPRVTKESGKPILVDYQRAMIKSGDEFQIYYGRPIRWTGKEFTRDKDGFLDLVQTYDSVHPLHAQSPKDLAYFEDYYSSHPGDFCALSDCYSLSRRLGLADKMAQYRRELQRVKDKPVTCGHCDPWINGRNQVAQQLFLEWVFSNK